MLVIAMRSAPALRALPVTMLLSTYVQSFVPSRESDSRTNMQRQAWVALLYGVHRVPALVRILDPGPPPVCVSINHISPGMVSHRGPSLVACARGHTPLVSILIVLGPFKVMPLSSIKHVGTC